MIRFTVPGTPVPQPRPRVTRRGGAYVTGPIKGYKQAVSLLAYQHCKSHLASGTAVRLTLAFVFSRPKRPTHDYPSTCDVDNLAKAVMDALLGHAYEDDRQVVELVCRKCYGPESYTTIEIETL